MSVTIIKKDDIIILQVPCGDMPPNRAKSHMDTVKNKFTELFENTFIVLPTISKDYSFEVIRKE